MSPLPSPGIITEEQARERIHEALRGEGDHRPRELALRELVAAGTQVHPNLGRLLAFTGPLGDFLLAERGGALVAWDGPKRFTIPEAKAYARAFLERNVPGFARRNFTLLKSAFDAPVWREEYLEKPRPPREVSVFENWIVLTVNVEARRVQHFDCSNFQRVRHDAPRIAEPAARARIAQRFPTHKLLALALLEDTQDGGQTFRTVWHAVLQPEDPDDPRYLYAFDADSGEELP
ncbi:MAG TPA: hypothetical protein VKF62_00790 [Planctomycetota bacterium]|nr:hypothetical protein [Planctomycetota bacterium]